MKVTADTNILVRAVVMDDRRQGKAAAALLRDAELIAVPIPCLCELVWVLKRVYGVNRPDIAAALHALLDTASVAVDRPAADAGLAVFEAGGDFADGVIAHQGNWLGADTFVSFDAKGISLLTGLGQPARLLA